MPVKEGVAGAIQDRLGLRQPQTEYLSAPKGMSPKKYVPVKMDVLPIGKLSLSVPESEMSEKSQKGKWQGLNLSAKWRFVLCEWLVLQKEVAQPKEKV